jgi:oligo-1,6-glucosidase
MSGPRIHEFLAEMHREVFAGREAELITVGEMPGVTVEEARLFTDPARAEVDMVFQFEHVSLDQGPGGKWDYRGLDLRDLKTSWNRWQKGLSDTGWNSLYLDNHDQPRLVSRFGDDGAYRYESATLWAALLHLHRGTPYIYQGEELGMTNVPFTSIEDFRDVESLNWYEEATMKLGRDPQDVLAALRRMSRDNARTPVQWTGGPQAGFTTGIPWIDVNPNYPSVNAELDRSSPRSVYRFYQRLIALRHGSAVVQRGRFELEQADHPVLYAFTRTLDGVVLRVLGNVSGEPLGLPPALGGGRLLLGNYGDDDAGTARGGSDDAHTAGSAAGHGRAGRVPAMEQDTLRPWEVRILDVS